MVYRPMNLPQQMQAQYYRDPRLSLASRLQLQGSSTDPVQHWAQGLGRLAQALAGTYIGGKVDDEYKERGERYASDLNTLMAPAQIPATEMDPQGGSRPATMAEMLQRAQGVQNPDLGPMVQNLAMGAAQSQAEDARFNRRNQMEQQTWRQRLEETQALQPPPTRSFEQSGNKITQEWDPTTRTYREIGRSPLSASQGIPSSIQEWNYYNSLPPDQKNQYIMMKRANPYLNIGGAMVQPDPTNPGQVLGSITKTLPPEQTPETKGEQAAAAASGKLIGETRTQAKLDLPKVQAEAEYTINLLNELVKDPGLPGVVGIPSASGLLRIPGTAEAGFRTRLNQIKGKQFLQAFESLKGGGAITEVEGTKAEQAIARMDTAQKEEDFIAAANEFKNIIQTGLNRARQKAGGGGGWSIQKVE